MKIPKKIMLVFTIIMVSVIIINIATVDVSASHHYILDSKDPKIKIPLPLTYEVKTVIHDLGEEVGYMKEPEDIFVSDDGIIYVVDTGNNRIIKMKSDGKVIGVFDASDNKGLLNPKGIFVDNDGDMYIADTGNLRILHLSPDGEYVEEFSKPETTLVGETFVFDPEKLCINSVGNIYVIKGYTLSVLDAYNNFRGMKMPEKLSFSLSEALVNMFASKEQKERALRRTPPPYSNLVIDDKGIIYATAINTPRRQIQMINSIGSNIYTDKVYGETTTNENGELVQPYFVDLAVDKKGVISALEQNSGKIYQYDQEGNLLAVFGGKGKLKGCFEMPSSIAVDSEGRIYVLDKKLNNIQIFEPTRFISLVHSATWEYSEGRYNESLELWDEVLKINENYQLAHRGKAKALMKQRRWKEAMSEFESANDKEQYSLAFSEYRHEIFREKFGLVLLLTIIVICLLYFIINKSKELINKIVDDYIYGRRYGNGRN